MQIQPFDCGEDSEESHESRLRRIVEEHLASQGFLVHNGRLITAVVDDKAKLRQMHRSAVLEKRLLAEAPLRKLEDRFLGQMTDAASIDPAAIQPTLHLIEDKNSFDAKLWRWCSLHWSIPVSAGYGRRLRFLVRDSGHGGALMGVIGLGDPVFALRPRDEWIGWSPERRRESLTSVLDAYVLGAAPPYTGLLGGKLVALLATTQDVRDQFDQKYAHRRTTILDRDPNAELMVLTTTSALGRSSIYNRLKRPNGELCFEPIGYTSGTGDFHLSGDVYDLLAEFARGLDGVPHRHKRWGEGFRNRREVIQKALYGLGYDGFAMRAHGVRRQVFAASIVPPARAILTGATTSDARHAWTASECSAWWHERWCMPRSVRSTDWRTFSTEDWRIWAS